jgi:hypothetical protein
MTDQTPEIDDDTESHSFHGAATDAPPSPDVPEDAEGHQCKIRASSELNPATRSSPLPDVVELATGRSSLPRSGRPPVGEGMRDGEVLGADLRGRADVG